MTPHKVPEGHDHFYGFSRFSKQCLPYNFPNIFSWTDIDCIFENYQTGELHLIEIKLNDAPCKKYQYRILKKLEQLGVKIHFLRMYFSPKYFGDHDNLGDPQLAEKIEWNGESITLDELKQKLCELKGVKL